MFLSDRAALVVVTFGCLLLITHRACGWVVEPQDDVVVPSSVPENGVLTNATASDDKKTAAVPDESTTIESIEVNQPLSRLIASINDTNVPIDNATTPMATTNIADVEEDEKPQEIELSSQNYPKPYPGMYSANWSVSVDANKWTSIEVKILSLDIDEATDILYFRAGNEHTVNKTGITLTGKLETIKEFKLMLTTELYIFFQSNTKLGSQKHRGFQLTYAPFGRVATENDEQTTTTTVRPIRELQSYTIYLNIAEPLQVNETWHTVRGLLASSANQYTHAHNLSVTNATLDNVVLQTVIACPNTWANPNCVRIRFAIPLAAVAFNSTLTTEHIVEHDGGTDELTAAHLEDMWRTVGIEELARLGLVEYSVPDADYMLLMWSAVGLAVVLVFLLLLYSIWKMDILRDYHRMPGGKAADDQKTILARGRSEIDISMFPSPHQIVPSLFPAGDPMSGPGGLQHEYESRPIRFSREDFPASRADHDRHHMFTPNIVNFNEPSHNALHMTTFATEEEVTFDRRSLETTARQRPVIRGVSNHESIT